MPMASAVVRLCAGFVLAAALLLSAPTVSARPAPDGFADLAERLLPAVVNISTTQNIKKPDRPGRAGPEAPQFPPGSPFEEFFKEFFERRGQNGAPQGQQHRRATSLGSGFVIDPSGLIVTNNHVIDEADEVTVIFHGGETLKAEILGRDVKTDLAVLKVNASKPLAFVPWGEADKTRIGDWVLAIGNPFGLGGTVTAGILSARARNINAGPYDDFLQTDAPINRGNSGGPLFNLQGEVIGVNSAIYSPTGGSVGIGFAIPSTLAKPVIEQLKASGKVRRGWLGVRIQTVSDEIAESLKLGRARGAMVSGMSEGGPAAKAKLETGDVILRFNGREVTDMQRLPRIVAETAIGQTVDVVVWRKGAEKTLRVTVGELKEEAPTAAAPPAPGQKPERAGAGTDIPALGAKLAAIDAKARETYNIDDGVAGLVVVDVKSDGPAAEKGLQRGDVVQEVDQEPVTSAAEVLARVKAAKAAGKRSVLLLLNRKGDARYEAVRIE